MFEKMQNLMFHWVSKNIFVLEENTKRKKKLLASFVLC